jgi:hypothetical protein
MAQEWPRWRSRWSDGWSDARASGSCRLIPVPFDRSALLDPLTSGDLRHRPPFRSDGGDRSDESDAYRDDVHGKDPRRDVGLVRELP